VDRVLVNAAIKRQLCLSVSGERSWLQHVRPWFGHASHMHLHYSCPVGQAECVDQPPPPPGDGCDATLQWWFDRLDKPATPQVPAPEAKPVVLPPACRAIMAMP
jgi:penicillin-insensitive murein endopeptidase